MQEICRKKYIFTVVRLYGFTVIRAFIIVV